MTTKIVFKKGRTSVIVEGTPTNFEFYNDPWRLPQGLCDYGDFVVVHSQRFGKRRRFLQTDGASVTGEDVGADKVETIVFNKRVPTPESQ